MHQREQTERPRRARGKRGAKGHSSEDLAGPLAETEAGPIRLQGSLDRAEADGTLEGWCWSPDEPQRRRELDVLVNGQTAASVLANQYRGDLASINIGDGRHAFVLMLPAAAFSPAGGTTVEIIDTATKTVVASRRVTQRGLEGNLDELTASGRLSGWCRDPNDSDRRIELLFLADGTPIGNAKAILFRPDLKKAGIGNGRYGFEFAVHPAIVSRQRRCRISAIDKQTGQALGEPREVQFTGVPLKFEQSTAIFDLGSRVKIARVQVDREVITPPLWRITRRGSLRISLDPAIFDSRQHHLAIEWGGPHAGETNTCTFQADYRGNIDELTDTGASGWLFDALRPTARLSLEVRCGREPPEKVEICLERPDLVDIASGEARVGFTLRFPPQRTKSGIEQVSISVVGNGYQPFGTIFRGVSRLTTTCLSADAGRAFLRSADRLLYTNVLLPTLLARCKEYDDDVASLWKHKGVIHLPLYGKIERLRPRIAVIIPVYRSAVDTINCIRSVLGSGNVNEFRLIVVDDCSPDAELTAALREMAKRGLIDYIRHDTNLGFVASANAGIEAAVGCDVLLLNSDTIVPRGFLDRLYRVAYSDRTIATVTPLSNNATIFSLLENSDSQSQPLAGNAVIVDMICEAVNSQRIRDVPTAHGFCIYIKRVVLDHIGSFDEAEFGPGYGEENDLSLRAFVCGWRNVAATNVYVYHKGSVSFGSQRQEREAAAMQKLSARYPFYQDMIHDFMVTDPLFDARNAVLKVLWNRGAPIILIVTLAFPGGVARHASDLAARFASEGWQVLVLSETLVRQSVKRLSLRNWGSNEAMHYPPSAPLASLLADITELSPQFICVEHLIDLPDGLAEFIQNSGIPYAVVFHDFFYACPRVTLLDEANSYCGMPPASVCTGCIARAGSHAGLHSSLRIYSKRGEAWRAKWSGFLRGSRQLIAPSRDTAERYGEIFPGLTIDVRPHFRGGSLLASDRKSKVYSNYSKIRVAVPGHIQSHKGLETLLQLIQYCKVWADDIQFFIVGDCNSSDFVGYSSVRILGRYSGNDAVRAIARARCRVALFLSRFPETYCYALSEALEASLVPVAVDFGALGERLRHMSMGVLIPSSAAPAAIVEGIRTAARLPAGPASDSIYAHYAALFGDYFSMDAPKRSPRAKPRLLSHSGVDEIGRCSRNVTLGLWSPEAITTVVLTVANPDKMPIQLLTVTCNEQDPRRVIMESTCERIIEFELSHSTNLVYLACRFDYGAQDDQGVEPCAAKLLSLRLHDTSGTHDIFLPTPVAA